MADKTYYSFAVLLELTTSDPRLTEAAFAAEQTVQSLARIRRAVLQHLPKGVTRVVAMMPTEHAKAISMLHEAFGREILGEEIARRVPGFIPPTQD